MRASKKLLALSAAMLFGSGSPSAFADSFHDWWNQSTLTGDWGGVRTDLADKGIAFTGSYTGELADNMAGGKRQGSTYAQQWALNSLLDLDKLLGVKGASLNVGFNFREGRSASADFVGNEQTVQSIYGGGETERLSEFSYSQALAKNKIDLKVGFYSMGNDFGGMVYGCNFQNPAFCAHLMNLPISTGWIDSPQGRWGGRARVNFTPSLYFQIGAFDVNPTYTRKGNGLKVSTSGSTGAIIPMEMGYFPKIHGMLGHYKAGFYYDTTTVDDVVETTRVRNGRYGWYFLADQMVASFGGGRGLIAFADVSYSDPMTSTYRGSVLGGLELLGPFAARPHDFISLGYARAIINHRVLHAHEVASDGALENLSTGEGLVEFGYGFQITPWLQIHPDIQYIIDPGTFSYNRNLPNAWVFGTQVKITI